MNYLTHTTEVKEAKHRGKVERSSSKLTRNPPTRRDRRPFNLQNTFNHSRKKVVVLLGFNFLDMHNNHSAAMKEKSSTQEVVDGSDIMELVENERVFRKFVDHKFQELDGDGDGKLSVKELQPAVADIGSALGLPAQGTSTDSDHIYTEVLNEFTDGKHNKIGKTKFKEVLSDFLVGMAAGLKRDPVVILRIDGEELRAFVDGPTFEPEMISIFSEIDLPNGSLKDYVVKAFEKLSIDHGMPPSTDHLVMCDIVEPALQSLGGIFEQPVSQETFFAAFQRSVEGVSLILKEKPIIVAHSQNTFDGSGIRSLMSNKFELDKTLDLALKNIPKDRNGKLSKDFLNVALDAMTSSAGLPPLGALQEVDYIMIEALKMFNANDGKTVKEGEFRKILREVLGSIMLQLEGNPVSVSVNSVVHEPAQPSSTLMPTALP